MLLKITKFLYRLFPKKVKNSKLFNILKIVHWKYIRNFKRYIFLKRFNFDLTKEEKLKFEDIKNHVSNKGIKIEDCKSLFSNEEEDSLNKILLIAKEKGDIFENQRRNKTILPFIEKLKKKGIYKPFRFDLGNYLNFQEKIIDSEEFENIHYELLNIGLKKEFLYLASKYLGIYPFLGRFYAWYDFPTEENAVSSQCWHRDGDDKKFLKIFIYLNEVNQNNGPFCYIENTHSINNASLNFNSKKTKYSTFNILEDEDAKKIYSKNDIRECYGKFGTTIFADTSGFHKGKSLESKNRIMLVFEYFSQSSNHVYDLKINENLTKKFSSYQLAALRKI